MFNLPGYLRKRRAVVNAALDREMPSENTRPRALHAAMRYALFTGGKRLRPILCMAACEAVSSGQAQGLLPALAVEILHTYTLVHDDLPSMDDDEMRRGSPTVHVAFGEANAILVGDALQALSFELLSRASVAGRFPSSRLVWELAVAAGSRGVVAGQVEDLSAPRNPDADTIRFIHLHKTADLFRAAARIGAITGGASDAELVALTSYGASLGLAFQIADDLLDSGPEHAQTPVNDRETTCLSTYSRDEAHRAASQHVAAASKALNALSGQHVQPLLSIAGYVPERTA